MHSVVLKNDAVGDLVHSFKAINNTITLLICFSNLVLSQISSESIKDIYFDLDILIA